jgi:hypothetical protein
MCNTDLHCSIEKCKGSEEFAIQISTATKRNAWVAKSLQYRSIMIVSTVPESARHVSDGRPMKQHRAKLCLIGLQGRWEHWPPPWGALGTCKPLHILAKMNMRVWGWGHWAMKKNPIYYCYFCILGQMNVRVWGQWAMKKNQCYTTFFSQF